MVAWAIAGMGGMVPQVSSRRLPDNMAEAAVNCDLSSGALQALVRPYLVHQLGVAARRAYRFPNEDGTDEAWLALPSEYSSVVRSPLTNDTYRRLYWTNPGDVAPWWTTYDLLAAGAAPFNVGIVQPSTEVGPTVVASGGTSEDQLPLVSRAYIYTYFNAYGEESAPSAPSEVTTGASDGSWVVAGWPIVAAPNPSGLNYAPVVGVRVYRTVTGQQTGAQYFRVAEWNYPSVPSTYDDTSADDVVVNDITLASLGWGNPPEGLDGLTALPGGFFIGFVGNTIHFSEPNRPHAWPAGYDQSLLYDIIGVSLWQQSLVVLTAGYPSTGAGNSPSNFLFSQVRVNEPCVARGSIVTDVSGVYYASQNGLIMLNYYGMKNQTLDQITQAQWMVEYSAANIVAARHEAQYLAINGTGTGFHIDYSDKRIGFVRLNTFADAVCVWSDEYNGDTYIITPVGDVYVWCKPTETTPLTYRWRSKQFFAPAPISIGACQVSLDAAVDDTFDETAPPLETADSTLALPEGVNAVLKIYAGPNAERLVLTKQLTKRRMIFRVPGGFKAFGWQCEVVARVPVYSVELATTMKELSGA